MTVTIVTQQWPLVMHIKLLWISENVRRHRSACGHTFWDPCSRLSSIGNLKSELHQISCVFIEVLLKFFVWCQTATLQHYLICYIKSVLFSTESFPLILHHHRVNTASLDISHISLTLRVWLLWHVIASEACYI
jgi:hypothetical protein